MGALVSALVGSSPVNIPGVPIGSYNGAANPSGAVNFASETHTQPQIYLDYLDGSSWSAMCGSYGSPPYVLSNTKNKLGSMRLVISIPLVTAGYSTPQTALAAYAGSPASIWNPNLTILAQNLVASGFGNAIIRLMWEPDSGIYSNDDLTSAANFATLWQNAHTSMMSVAGANFEWAWYWSGTFDTTTNNTAYPGSSYVDYITFDCYDQTWTSSCGLPYDGTPFTPGQSQCVWNTDTGNTLANLVSYASGKGKPIGIGEFGVINRSDNHGGNDDPTFISNFAQWIVENNVAWVSYFNFNSGGDSVLSDFPNSETQFIRSLGNNSGNLYVGSIGNHPFSSSSLSSYTVTTTVNQGDLLLLAHLGRDTGHSVSSVIDNFGNHYTWSQVDSYSATNPATEIWAGLPPTTGSIPSGDVTVTVTMSSADTGIGAILMAVRGPFNTSSPIESHAVASGNSTTPDSGTITPSNNNDLVISFVASAAGSFSELAAWPWTTYNEMKFSGVQYASAAWQSGTGGVGVSASWTTNSGHWVVISIVVAHS